jgi:UTP--glucose-1-phosphate uridylyltransferase
VEKPTPAKAPSRLGVTGRYVFTPEIFNALRHTKPGVGNEIQITDAIAGLAARQPLFAYRYEGDYYDCGDKERFLEAQIHAALERPDLSRKLRAYLRAVV